MNTIFLGKAKSRLSNIRKQQEKKQSRLITNTQNKYLITLE